MTGPRAARLSAQLALLALLASLAGCRCQSDAPAERVALLIGVDRQADPGIAPLPGAANDVALMRRLLIDRFGFSFWDITTLTGEDATAAGIREAVQTRLIERAGPGTVAVLHFSGHGRPVSDTSGDEPDGNDEAIVPYDARSGFEGAEGDAVGILDDEIGEWLDALVDRGATVTFIFDSCYSGSPARDDSGVVRAAPPIGGARSAGVDDGQMADRSGRFVVVSAAQSDQTAGEAVDDRGNAVGLFTWALVKTLRQPNAPTTWRAVAPVLAREIGLRNRSQVPELAGEAIDQQVFGLDAAPMPPGALSLRTEEGRLLLEGGALHGVTAGSTWAIVRPQSDEADAPLAEVREVGAVTARLAPPRHPESGAELELGPLPAGTWAVERSRVLRADPPRVAIGVDVDPQIADALGAIGIEPVTVFAPLRLVVEGAEAHFRWLDGRPLGAPMPAEPAAIAQAAWRLTHWLRLARLDGGYPANAGFELQGARRGPRGTWRVHPDDAVRLAIENREQYRKWHVTVLDLSDDGSITRLWPPVGGEQRLDPGRGVVVPERGGLTIAFPPGRKHTVDVLKLVLTAERVDFTPLVRGNADAGGHPLVRWLSATRGSTTGTLRPSQWAISTLWVETCAPEDCPP